MLGFFSSAQVEPLSISKNAATGSMILVNRFAVIFIRYLLGIVVCYVVNYSASKSITPHHLFTVNFVLPGNDRFVSNEASSSWRGFL